MKFLLLNARYVNDINYDLIIKKFSSNDFVKELFNSKSKEELALEYLNNQHKSFIYHTILFKDFYLEALELIDTNISPLTNSYYSNSNLDFIVEYKDIKNFDLHEFMNLIFTDFTVNHFDFLSLNFNNFFQFKQDKNKIIISYVPNFYEVSIVYENDINEHSID